MPGLLPALLGTLLQAVLQATLVSLLLCCSDTSHITLLVIVFAWMFKFNNTVMTLQRAALWAVVIAATILLLVKPQDIPGVVDEIAPLISDGTVVISLAAGVRLAALESRLPRAAVVRAMPNTPALVDLGITAISPGASCSPQQAEYVESLLSAVGPVVRVPEELQDAVTATSGSGPAYVFRLVEAMVAGAIELGIDPDVAHQLVTQTVLGAATMAAQIPPFDWQ